MKQRIFSAIGIVLLVVVLDQAAKAWVYYDLMSPPKIIEILPFLDIILTWNKGVGFGFLKADSVAGTFGLIGLALAITVVLGIMIIRSTDKLSLLSLSMIIGGAIGNVIDRLRFGAVLDFIYVHLYILGYHFPAFNVADSAITLGACFLILETFMRKKS